MVAIALAARYLGVDRFGQFSGVIAIVGILATFVNLGIDPIIFRQFSKHPNNYNLINTGLSIRVIAFLITVGLFNVSVLFIEITGEEIILTNILFLTIFLSAKIIIVRELFAIPFKVHLKMHYPMVFMFIDYLFLLIGIIALKLVGITLLSFVVFYTLSSLPGFILTIYILKRKFNYKFKFSLTKWKYLLKEAAPIFGTVILGTLFIQFDIILIRYYSGEFNAGIYSAASRLTTPLSIIPGAIVTTVFPIIVKKMKEKNDSNFVSNFVFKILFLISFCMSAIFMFQAEFLINIVYGNNYIQSADTTIILYWSQIFIFFNFYSLNLLIAKHKQNYNFIYSALLVISNIILNVILIPLYSIEGSAYAKVLAAVLSSIFLIYALYKSEFRFQLNVIRIILWSVIVIGSAYGLSKINVVGYFIIIPIIILVATVTIQYFTKDEIKIMFRIINKEELGNRIIKKLGKLL